MGRLKRYSTVNSFAVMCLLGLLGMLALLVIILGSGFYQRVMETTGSTDQLRATANYISNRLRCSTENTVFKELLGAEVIGIKMGDSYDCLYFYDGWIMELAIADEGDFIPENGQRLIQAENVDLTFRENLGLLNVSVTPISQAAPAFGFDLAIELEEEFSFPAQTTVAPPVISLEEALQQAEELDTP